MSHTAYIVAARRTPVGKAPRGVFATTRPDDLLAAAMDRIMKDHPGLPRDKVEDVVIGCAMPEGEQGMNVARIATLLAGFPDNVPAMTINRFCSSGLQAVALAADRIRLGEADVMIAGGTETMSMVPMMGHNVAMNPRIFDDDHVAIAYGMGITAEKVATQWKVSRDDQDAFAMESHQRAIRAQEQGFFDDEIVPCEVVRKSPGASSTEINERRFMVDRDEGPRADTSPEVLARLRTVFRSDGSVTAGNSSQMSDGAGALLLCSEQALKDYELTPIARFVGYSVAGVAPEIMGIGPIEAIPRALKQTGLNADDMDWIELNEAFAAQSLAVIRDLGLDPAKVNPNGGAIALGHPLGATGAIRSATALHGLKRTDGRYGMVTMCIGTGMGAAGVFERL